MEGALSTNPLFSVVIPARNGKDRLAATLDSIAASKFDLDDVEVIVVDDGSTDGTYEAFCNRSYPFRFEILLRDFVSQSAATNEAIRQARGTFVLSSAQDILFAPDLLQRHHDQHRRCPDEQLVVLGKLPYAEQLGLTPFMFYLVSGGFQFAYHMIHDPMNVPPNFLYSPNFSVGRELLDTIGGFDERFPFGYQDTDLGIRLLEQGARIVYDQEAIGYHNHPVELAEYCKRQRVVGHAAVELEAKHPDYEGGPTVHDAAILHYLMFSDVQMDRFQRTVQRLEPQVHAEGPHYQRLWDLVFCQGVTNGYTEADSATVRRTQLLFSAYNAILSFDWGRGYLEKSIETHGKPRVEQWLRARLLKGQLSIPVRRTLRHRLRGLDLDPDLCSPGVCRSALVVYDLADYGEAVNYIERFEDPPGMRCNVDLILVLNGSDFSKEELERLGLVAEVVVGTDRDAGVLKAVLRSRAEVVNVTSSGVEPLFAHNVLLAEKMFDRLPQVAVLGGAVDARDGSTRRYGYRKSGAELTLSRGEVARAAGNVEPIDVSIPEFCLLRRSAIQDLLERLGDGIDQAHDWNETICGLAKRAERLVLHVPQLTVRRVEQHTGDPA